MFRIITKLFTGPCPGSPLSPCPPSLSFLPRAARPVGALVRGEVPAARKKKEREKEECWRCRQRDDQLTSLACRCCGASRVPAPGLAPRCPPTLLAPGGEAIPFRVLGDHNDEAWFQNKSDDRLAK
jgi:hypothetical protein